jgi:ribonuclease P protein component
MQQTDGNRIAAAPFPRSARLIKPAEFERVFERNAHSVDGYFRVIARPSTGAGSRLGLAVSKKVERRAVGRNRIKRAVREAFRLWCAQAPETALDIVVLARPAAAGSGNAQLFSSLERHWPAVTRRVARRFDAMNSPEDD